MFRGIYARPFGSVWTNWYFHGLKKQVKGQVSVIKSVQIIFNREADLSLVKGYYKTNM